MNLRDFKIGWRMMLSQPVYSAVVIFGLSIGFAACFLLLSYVRFSLNFDANVPQVDRVYLMKTRLNIVNNPKWYESTPLRFLPIAKESGLVDQTTVVYPQSLSVRNGNQIQTVDVFAVDPGFQEIFGIKSIAGDLQTALLRPDSVALTESTAHRLFGDVDIIGKTVQFLGKTFTVQAIVADPPSNSTLPYGALASINGQFLDEENRNDMAECYTCLYVSIYLKLKGNASPVELQRILQNSADHSPLIKKIAPEVIQKLGHQKVMDIGLGSLRNMYFDDDTARSTGSSAHGNRTVVLSLSAVAMLILLLAATNYVNLATVRTMQRQHEIAVLKVLGAGRDKLFFKFIAESVVVATIATCVGLVLTWILLPAFSDLVGRNLDNVFTPSTLCSALGLGILIGILSALSPTWHAVKVRPPSCLLGRSVNETKSGQLSRRVVTVMQFATTMALVSITLAVAWQTDFARNGNPGFDPDHLLVVVPHANFHDPAAIGMRDALEKIPGVSGVSRSLNPVGLNWGVYHDDVWVKDGNRASLTRSPISANFFDVYGLKPLAGRLLDESIDSENSNVAVINASAVHALGFRDPQDVVGQSINFKRDDKNLSATIVGVAPDIRYGNLHETSVPVFYQISPNVSVSTVRVNGEIAGVETEAEKIAQQYFPDEIVSVRTAKSYLADVYEEDLRLTKVLCLSSIVSAVIAAFGIYVLSAYSFERRSREIVLRKLYGATHGNIAKLIASEFLTLIGISALIGLPIAALGIHRYLAAFVEHAPIGGWTLLAASFLALMVTFFSTLRHTLIAMRTSPARILRG